MSIKAPTRDQIATDSEPEDRWFVLREGRSGFSEAVHAGSPQSCKGYMRLLAKRMRYIIEDRTEDETALWSFQIDNGTAFRIVGGLEDREREFYRNGFNNEVVSIRQIRHRWKLNGREKESLRGIDLGEKTTIRRKDEKTAEVFTRVA